MSIVFSVKPFAAVINDPSYTRYSDPASNELLGSAEKYFLEVLATTVAAGTANVQVTLETSNDNVNWTARTTAINQAISSGTVLFASDFAGGQPIGRYARYGVKLTAQQTTAAAYIELWVTGRDAR